MPLALWLSCALALAGCQETRVTPPAYIDRLHVRATAAGLDVSFVLLDGARKPTIMMLGQSVIRIEDADDSFLNLDASDAESPPADSMALTQGAERDSVRVLYSRRLVLSRDYFVRERADWGFGADEEIDVCHLGVFPYEHFIHRPQRRRGIVRVAVVGMDGETVMQAWHTFQWPADAFGDER